MSSRSLSTILIVIGANIQAQTSMPAQWNTSVRLVVAGPEEFKTTATSYLGRELRSLGDITLVESNPVFSITVFAINNSTVGGSNIGYTMHVQVTKNVRPELLSKIIVAILAEKTEKQKQASANLINSYLAGAVTIERSMLYTGSYSKLQSICSEAIVDVDTAIFEPARRGFRKYVEDLTAKPTK